MTHIIPPLKTTLLNQRGLVEVTNECKDLEGNVYAVGETRRQIVNTRSLWRQKEKDDWKDFHRLRRKWLNERIPILRGELEEKLLKRFKTTSPARMELNLNIQMMSDPRLNVMTRKGVRKTSVDGQRDFAAKIASCSTRKMSQSKT